MLEKVILLLLLIIINIELSLIFYIIEGKVIFFFFFFNYLKKNNLTNLHGIMESTSDNFSLLLWSKSNEMNSITRNTNS